MQCPKDKKITLEDGFLAGNLPVKQCPDCKGTWIPATNYEQWQERQVPSAVPPETLVKRLDVDFVQSPLDTRAALCPECNRYLARAKVMLKSPFYVERCPNCNGIWCDRGEWEILTKLGLHATIQQLFSNEWQARVMRSHQTEKEKQATADKLGAELAERLFELADLLENHPNGDFGVAYLMRRFNN